MTESENAANRGDGRGPEEDDRDQDAPRPFLGPLVKTLQPYRRIVGGVLGLAALFVVVAGLGLWSYYYPVQKKATLDFRIDFDGIQDGKYPNGSKFSVEDLLSEPILRRVYDENGLQKYTGFQKFHEAVFVTSSNRALELLEMEYRGRLADAKLQPIDRQRIEREFHEKAGALKISTFHLTLIRSERLREMDASLMEKVLRGILNGWADDAAKTRGALKYDLPIYSRTMIRKEEMQSQDFLIGIDMLRTKVNRVVSSVDELLKVPGIQLFRLPGAGMSLPEIRFRLVDINNYQIGTALGVIREMGISKGLSPATRRYVDNRLFEVSLDLTMAQERERKLREAFDTYVRAETPGATLGKGPGAEGSAGAGRESGTAAVIPQLGESFIDRLMQLGNRTTDVGFRQDLTERIIAAGTQQVAYAKEVAFYKDIQSAFRRTAPRLDKGTSAYANAAKQIESGLASAAEELGKALDDIQAIYDLISARNLRPASFLYTVEAPAIIDSTSAFSFSRYLALGVLFVGFAGCAAAAGALVHARLRAGRG
jgi:hypothetical protein